MIKTPFNKYKVQLKKGENGITLISLAITILVLLILSTIGISSGIESIRFSYLTKFSTELKIMQTEVNELYDNWKNGRKVKLSNGQEFMNDEIINSLGEDISKEPYLTQANKVFTEKESGITNMDGYRYFSKELIKALEIEEVDQDFFINIKTRSVVSYNGLKYKNKRYYTIEQLPDSLYNVEYNKENSGVPIFDVSYSKIEESKWRIDISNIKYDKGYIDKWYVNYKLKDTETWNTSEDNSFIVNKLGTYNIKIFNGNVQSDIEDIIIVNMEVPKYWEATTNEDTEWYSYGGKKVNAPQLKGAMAPIKYTGEIAETEPTANNKWANALTSDGSMWVWIPRYAYKITEGYHSATAGKIEVAFIDTENNFLNGENGEIIDDPSKVTYTTEGVQEQWLVHPAFTSNATNGGGFGELEGLWVAKFEATGSNTELSVKPGEKSLVNMTTNSQFKLAKTSNFNENLTAEKLGSHMAKNSEWGAVAYLGHSEYGTKGKEVEKNIADGYITGGSSNQETIYTENKKQSTTHNATGIYDMNGGTSERVAAYVYNPDVDNLTLEGENQVELFCEDAGTERSQSTAYKTVYAIGSKDKNVENYEANILKKGDATYETSASGNGNTDAWFNATSKFVAGTGAYFYRGSRNGTDNTGVFFYNSTGYKIHDGSSFRPVLAFIEEETIPNYWEATNKEDTNWFSYGGATVNAPKLKGKMTPIKYIGIIDNAEPTANNKWANAITADGSMWVWIPRYAYKITEGYHTNQAGTIEVAFIDTENNFLNGESGEITDDPSNVTYTEEGVQEQWLVHPAFTSNAENGGGFGELEGLWVGKFEATGTYNAKSGTGTLSVKPGKNSLVNMTTNLQFKLAKTSNFNENLTAEQLGSHMAKNSEWGAVAYLGHSKYGTNGEKVEKNEADGYITGGSSNKKTIYTTNKKQSTTHNATGVYDMNGGTSERVASYVYNPDVDYLTPLEGEEFLLEDEGTGRGQSTAYKTVYAIGYKDEAIENYEENSGKKGDAIYETSAVSGENSTSAWFDAEGKFANTSSSYFYRGSRNGADKTGVFYFGRTHDSISDVSSFRPVLAF